MRNTFAAAPFDRAHIHHAIEAQQAAAVVRQRPCCLRRSATTRGLPINFASKAFPQRILNLGVRECARSSRFKNRSAAAQLMSAAGHAVKAVGRPTYVRQQTLIPHP